MADNKFGWVKQENINSILSSLALGEEESALAAAKGHCAQYDYAVAGVSPRRIRLSGTTQRANFGEKRVSFIRSSLKSDPERLDLRDFGNGFYASFEGESVYVTDGTVIAKASVPNTESGGVGEIEAVYLRVLPGGSTDDALFGVKSSYSSVFGQELGESGEAPARISESGRPFDQMRTRGLIDSGNTCWVKADRNGIYFVDAEGREVEYSQRDSSKALSKTSSAPRTRRSQVSELSGASVGGSKGYDGDCAWDRL